MAGMYDWLLVIALIMMASLPIVMLNDGPVPTGHPAYQLMLLVIAVGFFFYCWMRTGQTPGMKTWHIRLVTTDNSELSYRHCAIRYAAAVVSIAAGGLGYWWAWSNPERLTWHDLWSNTRLERVENPRKK